MKSILQEEKRCYVCGADSGLHLHHVFYGTANRRQSDKYGCTCYLCGIHHNLSDAGVHFDKDLDLKIKRDFQKKFENIYSHDKFMQVFGRNYL